MNELLLLTNDNYLIRILQTELKPFDMILRVENLFSDGIKYMRNNHFKSVIIKLPLNTESCPKKIIKTIKSVNPFVPVYFLMDYVDHRDIITLIKEGAENVFIKPYNFTLLGQELQETISRINSNNKSIVVPENENAHHYMRANSKAAQGLYAQIDKVADTNFTVIIYGETGTGKESVARQLCKGKYKDKPFVAVDCGCLNKELAGSELFGHKKGSFTNAISDKIGAFEEANHGTLFLDEIGNLDYNVQVQLLRAIEEKKIKKIGSHEEKEVNVRIIVASNEKLLNAVKEGRFREDLYYRLNEFEINIPPLRKRKDDIEAFIKHFISVTNRKLNKNVRLIKLLSVS